MEPSIVAQAMKHPLWRQAMDVEYSALQANGTWVLVPPSGQKTIGCKWVFHVKRNLDGIVARFKARLWPNVFCRNPGVITMRRLVL